MLHQSDLEKRISAFLSSTVTAARCIPSGEGQISSAFLSALGPLTRTPEFYFVREKSKMILAVRGLRKSSGQPTYFTGKETGG